MRRDASTRDGEPDAIVAAMSAQKSIAYSMSAAVDQNSGNYLIMWQLDPWIVGDDDYVAIYESYADLEKDFQRVAEGRDPTYQKTYEWVQDMKNRYWSTDYPPQSGWVFAYWSKNYAYDSYVCLMWTNPWP
jgi:hypothetical protein